MFVSISNELNRMYFLVKESYVTPLHTVCDIWASTHDQWATVCLLIMCLFGWQTYPARNNGQIARVAHHRMHTLYSPLKLKFLDLTFVWIKTKFNGFFLGILPITHIFKQSLRTILLTNRTTDRWNHRREMPFESTLWIYLTHYDLVFLLGFQTLLHFPETMK